MLAADRVDSGNCDSVTLSEGVLCLVGIVFLFALGVYVWNRVPYYRCPECSSLHVDEYSAEGPTILMCKECGKTWKDVSES